MSKPIIAVDLDDVLGDENMAIMRFINQRYKLMLTAEDYDIPADYWGYWEKVWDVDEEEGKRRYSAFLEAKTAKEVILEPLPGAIDAIRYLEKLYELTVVSSRHAALLPLTKEWLEEHFPNTFKEVHFVELWGGRDKITKAKICRDIGASYLVDDNIEHCILAQEAGVQGLLFGDYGWNRHQSVPKGIVRVADWRAVKEYFDAK